MKKLDLVLDPLLNFHLQTILERGSTSSGLSLKQVNPKAWLREIATIKVDPGRQTGKSSYIARTATDKDVIICPDDHAFKHMVSRRRGFFLPDSHNMRVYLSSQWEDIEGEVQDVYIDEPEKMNEFDLKAIYDQFAGKCRRFIIIG